MSIKKVIKKKYFDIALNEDSDFEKYSKHPNITLDILEKFPNALWDFHALSINKNLDCSWLEKFPNANWNLFKIKHNICVLRKNYDLYWKLVDQFPQKKWDFKFYDSYAKINLQILKKYYDRNWCMSLLSKNANFDISWIIAFPDGNWDYIYLSNPKRFQLEWLERTYYLPWCYPIISRHPDISLEIINKYPKKRWDFNYIASKHKITMEWLDIFKSSRHLSFNSVTKNVNVPLKIIESCFPVKDWNFKQLSYNINLTLEFIKKYPSKDWDFYIMSDAYYSGWYNMKKITLEWLEEFPNENWCFWHLSNHPKLTIEWLQKFPDKNWDLKSISLRNDFWHLRLELQLLFPEKNIHFGAWKVTDIYLYLLKNLNIKSKCCKNNLHNIFGDEKPNLSLEEKKNVVRVGKQKIKLHKYYPNMFYNIDQALELQDLSGDIYLVTNWFESNNILKLAQEQHPQLGNFDIYLNSHTKYPDQLMSKTYNKHSKYLIFNNPNGPQGMIVYL